MSSVVTPDSSLSPDIDNQLFLGLDISTQQVKCVCVNSGLKVIHQSAVKYDTDLPQFRTTGGVHHHADNVTVTAPVLMWLEALDLLFERMKLSGFDFSKVTVLSGSAQQHGSVYWQGGALASLTNLQASDTLAQQLSGCFSVKECPNWMDASTTAQCHLLEKTIGGAQRLADITGSRAFERLTGNQIAKLYTTQPQVYDNTERISLVSSFGTSIFIGGYADIDLCDGSGMNLLDITARDWSTECLKACAPNLQSKLGTPVDKISAPIAKYFVGRYGFSSDCKVVTFTGDNPASLTGLCVKKGEAVVSLGSSDCVFLWIHDPHPTTDGHIYINPIDPTQYMALLCFKNGSLTRERIQNEVAEGSWDVFADMLKNTPMGNDGNIGFYFDCVEVQPLVSGVYRFDKNNDLVPSFSAPVEVRAVLESQFMLQRIYSHALGFDDGSISRILATGGASANKAILQVMADVFNTPVYVSDEPNSATLGAAYRAKHVWSKATFEETVKDAPPTTLTTSPTPGAQEVYSTMYTRCRRMLTELATVQEETAF